MSLKIIDEKSSLIRAALQPAVFFQLTDMHVKGALLVDFFMSAAISSETICWRPDLYDAAMSGKEAFVGRSDCPANLSTSQWWAIEGDADHAMSWQLPLKGHYTLKAILVAPSAEGIIAFYITTVGNQPVIHATSVPTNHNGHHDLPILAGLEFMGQLFIDKKPSSIKKSIRSPRGDFKYTPMFDIVVLRRQNTIAHRNNVALDMQSEWQHCWTVRGHWRKLHQPRKSDGATITYVNPCVKGDTDKPMLLPKERIIKVTR